MKLVLVIFLLILLSAFAPSNATDHVKGFESSKTNQSWVALKRGDFICLKKEGFGFFIGHVWQEIGEIDSNGVNSIKEAHAADWESVDGYFGPCLLAKCPSAASQMSTALTLLKNAGAKINTIWLLIGSGIGDKSWSTNQASNQQVIRELVNTAKTAGMPVGIFTTKSNWEAVVGNWSEFSQLPLWLAKSAGNQKFDKFGGWTHPTIYQDAKTTEGPCGVGSMNLDWKV